MDRNGQHKTTEDSVARLSKRYSKLRFVDSDTKGLYYALAPEDDRIAVLCGGGIALFTLEQLYTLSKEAIEVWTLNVDREIANM